MNREQIRTIAESRLPNATVWKLKNLKVAGVIVEVEYEGVVWEVDFHSSRRWFFGKYRWVYDGIWKPTDFRFRGTFLGEGVSHKY